MLILKNILLPLTFVICLYGSAETQQESTQQKRPSEAQIRDDQNPILSQLYPVARKALEKAISERDEATLRIGLAKASGSFKKEIVVAVRNAWFQSFVPDLIMLLEKNRGSTNANTGDNAERNGLDKTVVSALRHLTGLPFPVGGDELPTNEIDNAIEESRKWYQLNGSKIKDDLAVEMRERQQTTPILSKNYNIAKWAFDKAVLEKDKTTLRLGLKRESLSFKTLIIQAVSDFDDKSFVPDLIKVLQDNQVGMSGGSETQAEQRELNKEIIRAMRLLTGLKFSYVTESSYIPCFSDCPSKEIQQVLRESLEWCRLRCVSAYSHSSLENRILGNDYFVVESALSQAIIEKSISTLRLSLRSRFFGIRIKAVDAIAEMNDSSSVSTLVQALDENQLAIDGGTEIQVQQNELNKAIVSALEHLTKLEFKVSKRLASEVKIEYKPFSPQEMQEVLSKTRAWCESQKKQ